MHCGQSLLAEQIDVANVFRRYGTLYRDQHKLTRKQYRVMSAIESCRTPAFGYHLDQCNNCGHIEKIFNSCRDRHCPKCQGISRNRWVQKRVKEVLPVSYYHIVFTLPHLLERLISYNRKRIYNLLFSSAADTLTTFGRDPNWLGGEVGFTGVLHTWGQTLWPHPHIHFIVPGGALSKDNQWVESPFTGRFLFPVRALSKVFRGKFIEGLKTAHQKGELDFPSEDINLTCPNEFDRWLDDLVSKKWVVYCKRPFKDAQQVVHYIGRYTHRVAISNNRIFKINNGEVGFQYKDYKSFKSGASLRKTMVLTATEFIRRFLWHVLPSGFHKIRHYGFLANGRRIAVIRRNKSRLNANGEVVEEKSTYQVLCSKCKTGYLSTICTLLRVKDRFMQIGRIPKIQFQFDSS